jgi:hypothetical protein
MNWASTLKCVVCVLNLVMCARLVGPYMFPRKTDAERPRERRDVETFYRFAAWVGILAYSYGLGHGLMRLRDGWVAAAPMADVMLLAVQVLNLVVWACLLVRTRGGSL